MKKIALSFSFVFLFFGCLYFFNQAKHPILAKGCYARIPIQYIKNSPFIDAEIEGKKYQLKLDLGADCQFAFFKEVLENIVKKKKLDLVTTTDIKGNQYIAESYSIPLIKSKNLECKDAIVLEESKEFSSNGAILWRSDDLKDSYFPFAGRIGRDCFTSHNLFIDFPNSMMFITQDLEQLKMDDWPISPLSEVPFEMGKWGIVFSIETDLGIKKFILDTGANVSILRKASTSETVNYPVYTSQKFKLNSLDFGPFDLSLFDFTQSMDADGLLGMDFLRNQVIYLDFTKKKALIGRSSEICGAIRTKPCQIPIDFSSRIPLIKIEIEGKTHQLILDLSSGTEVALKKDVLDKISKKEWLGSYPMMDLEGHKMTVSRYLIQSISMPNSKIIHAIGEEDIQDSQISISGRIGRKIIQNSPFLLDLSHSKLLVLKNLENLQPFGYSQKRFVQIPVSQTRWGATFTIETDFGPKRFFINTAAVSSAIRGSSKIKQSAKSSTSKFKIGEIDLGYTRLDILDIDPSLSEIDGYLGTDFLFKNIFFVDLQNNIAGLMQIKK